MKDKYGTRVPFEPIDRLLQERGWGDEYVWLVGSTKDPAYPRLNELMKTGREQGRLNIYQVDELLCNFFHIHPATLYGPAWFTDDFGKQDESNEEQAA